MNSKWTYVEKQWLKDNADILSDKDCAQKLSLISHRIVTEKAVERMRNKLGLKKGNGRGHVNLL